MATRKRKVVAQETDRGSRSASRRSSGAPQPKRLSAAPAKKSSKASAKTISQLCVDTGSEFCADDAEDAIADAVLKKNGGGFVTLAPGVRGDFATRNAVQKVVSVLLSICGDFAKVTKRTNLKAVQDDIEVDLAPATSDLYDLILEEVIARNESNEMPEKFFADVLRNIDCAKKGILGAVATADWEHRTFDTSLQQLGDSQATTDRVIFLGYYTLLYYMPLVFLGLTLEYTRKVSAPVHEAAAHVPLQGAAAAPALPLETPPEDVAGAPPSGEPVVHGPLQGAAAAPASLLEASLDESLPMWKHTNFHSVLEEDTAYWQLARQVSALQSTAPDEVDMGVFLSVASNLKPKLCPFKHLGGRPASAAGGGDLYCMPWSSAVPGSDQGGDANTTRFTCEDTSLYFGAAKELSVDMFPKTVSFTAYSALCRTSKPRQTVALGTLLRLIDLGLVRVGALLRDESNVAGTIFDQWLVLVVDLNLQAFVVNIGALSDPNRSSDGNTQVSLAAELGIAWQQLHASDELSSTAAKSKALEEMKAASTRFLMGLQEGTTTFNDENCGIAKKSPGWSEYTGPTSAVGACYRGFGAAKVLKLAKSAPPRRIVAEAWTLEPEEKKRRVAKPVRLGDDDPKGSPKEARKATGTTRKKRASKRPREDESEEGEGEEEVEAGPIAPKKSIRKAANRAKNDGPDGGVAGFDLDEEFKRRDAAVAQAAASTAAAQKLAAETASAQMALATENGRLKGESDSRERELK